MKKLLAFMVILCLHLLMQAQDSSTQIMTGGIKWTEGLSWEQVKQKAIQEDKYIFLDCFATWCGPCKRMDKEVYTNDTVGRYFNEKFISVKIQMDKTKNDDSFIQSWYKDAETIGKIYHVEAYPSYIFFSPNGQIVEMQRGFMPVNRLVFVGKTATKPGRVYVDPYEEYYGLRSNYEKGIKNYDRMPYMIVSAGRLEDTAFARKLLHEHTDYVSKLDPQQRYTKEAIEMWRGYILRSDGPRFQFFYKDGDIIDKVMNSKGYAQRVVDKTIDNEIVQPFLKKQPTGNLMQPHYFKPGEVDYSDADWNELSKEIRKRFGKSYAKRIVPTTRINWYYMHYNMNAYIKYSIIKLEVETKDSIIWWGEAINDLAWKSFLHVTDTNQLQKVIPLMERLIKQYQKNPFWLDTYANLLYKSGKKQEGIYWEEKAMMISARYSSIVEQMKKGEPTYINQGANWSGIDIKKN